MPDERSKPTLRNARSVFLVGDITTTMRWYQKNLNFKSDPFPPSPPHVFCILTRDDVVIMLQQLDGYQKPDLYDEREGGVWSVYIRTDGLRELYEAVSRLDGVRVLEPLHRQPYGQMEFVIEDPNGYTLVFAEPV